MATGGVARSDRRAGGARLPYWPALDGLRGLAVAAVLLFHGDVSWARGGFLGVSLFFTLSGFLITSLALAEHRTTGTIGLRSFWARRVRRLVPASLVALLMALAVGLVVVPVEQRLAVIGDVRAALLNVANWRFVLQGAGYADLDLVPSPVQHYWSLAIEEQFYVVFPVVAALSLRWHKRGLAYVLAAVAVASVSAQLVLTDADRVYFGTDTRAAELAIGGLLAIALPGVRDVLGARLVPLADAAGLVGLIATLALWVGVDQRTSALYDGGLAIVGVVSSMLILGAVAGRASPRAMSVRPLVELGRISYGVYLFHFPIFLILTADRISLGWLGVLAVQVVVTLVVSVASYHLLERPIRSGRVLPGRPSIVVLAGAAVVVAVITVPAVERAERQQLDAGVLAAGVDIVSAVPMATPAVGPEAGDPGSGGSGGGAAVRRGEQRPPRIVVVGDSTAAANGAGLQRWGARTGRLEVATVSGAGCASLHGPRFRVRDGYTFVPQHCDELFTTAADHAIEIGADAIVVFIGSSQLADWELADAEGWHHVGEARMDRAYLPALGAAVEVLSTVGIPILWADVPVPEWDLDAFGEMLGGTIPGSGPVSLNDPARADRLNVMDQQVLSGHPMVQRWAYADELAAAEGRIPRSIRPDGLHVSEDGMATLAESGLVERLSDAYHAVLERSPAALRPPEPIAWSVSSPA